MRIAILAVAALAACATEQPQPPAPRVLTSDIAMQMPIATLCLGVSTWGPTSSGVASAELQRRGVDCRDHAAAVQGLQQQQAQQQAQQAQQRAAAAGVLLNQPAYQPIQIQPYQMPVPRQTNCTSQWNGVAWQTVCR